MDPFLLLSLIKIHPHTQAQFSLQNNRVWLDCEGENPADKENMGPIVYHPTRGISANYFPYLNQEGYLSPAVFVEFTKPKRK